MCIFHTYTCMRTHTKHMKKFPYYFTKVKPFKSLTFFHKTFLSNFCSRHSNRVWNLRMNRIWKKKRSCLRETWSSDWDRYVISLIPNSSVFAFLKNIDIGNIPGKISILWKIEGKQQIWMVFQTNMNTSNRSHSLQK